MKSKQKYSKIRVGVALLAFLLLPLAAHAEPGALFFSEYVEGSAFNKAVEVHNASAAPVDLAAEGYRIEIYFKGKEKPGRVISLEGVLDASDSLVIAHGRAADTLRQRADALSGALTFNGDDTVVLRNRERVVDRIGQAGFDPGESWMVAEVGTKDGTLRRKGSVCRGDALASDPFDPSAEWERLPKDTFGGLGEHRSRCGDR